MQIGKEEAKTLPFTSCDQGGCVAEYAITDAELAAIAKGANLTISARGERFAEALHPYRSRARLRCGLREDQVARGMSAGTAECQ